MVPVYGAIVAVIWKLAGHPLNLLSPAWAGILYTGVTGLFILSVIKCLRVNLPRLAATIPEEKDYEFSQIFILSMVYALTFGSELAVVSMFPEFLDETFGLSVITAGVLGSSFAFMNLVTRPGGGWVSDRVGRRRTLFLLVFGAMVAYWILGHVSSQWPLWAVITIAVICSMFLQAGNGACFAMVPLIRRDLTGKLAGIAGACGNVGAVLFLTALSFVTEQTFFKIIGGYALVVIVSLIFLKSFKDLHASYNGAANQ
jgi:NNP family nitrate/nitrite transporter-like MFS transporter